jgi:SPP1 family predicted phage head-tail adaptor
MIRRAGKLNQTILIERSTTTMGATGAPQESWSTLATMRAEIVEASTDEIVRENGANTEMTITFRTWFIEGVTCADRVTFEGRPHNIKSIKEVGHRRALEIKALACRESETLTRKAIDLGKGGDLAALRLCLERVVPRRKDRPVTFEIPPIKDAAEAATAMAAILTAVSAGQITPGEATEVARLVETFIKALEASELKARIERLERTTNL